MELDLNLRARIHALEKQLAAAGAPGLVETNAGVRSVMIEYEPRLLPLPGLLALVEGADAAIGDVAHMVLPSRIVHLPMAFDERYVAAACVSVCGRGAALNKPRWQALAGLSMVACAMNHVCPPCFCVRARLTPTAGPPRPCKST